ncbi:hypothetical protein [Streptomyces sp. V3I7]|uniref:hypothetical protein n=1 Tax=Streptomyces sp. V3I7 TaxID=3042278 RepID=UPI0027874ACA|nr:hypothetical protein [Streptomyces sp. V3I7]MDQ0992920.1 hypothetical protein [Streptomyces sp. V3I7]
MEFDPTDPEELAELEESDVTEIDVEAPEGDAAEQLTDVTEERDTPLTDEDADRASEADLIEQTRVVSLDEDDYR